MGEVYLFLSSLITILEQVLLLKSGELEATGALVHVGPDPLNRAQVCSPSNSLWCNREEHNLLHIGFIPLALTLVLFCLCLVILALNIL